MNVFRVGKTKYSRDLTGEGSRLFGGRWNHINTSCLYTSESRALAVLEYTVNVGIADIPKSLSITTLEIPDNLIHPLSIADLPENWNETPIPNSTKDFGTDILKKNLFAIIKIPSTVVMQEFNFILNPLHPNNNYFKVIDITDFVFDMRIKSV